MPNRRSVIAGGLALPALPAAARSAPRRWTGTIDRGVHAFRGIRYGIAERLLDDGAGASVARAPDSLRAFIDGHQRFKVPPGHACLHETRDRSAQTTRQGIRKCSGPMRSRMRTCEPSRSGTSDRSTLAPAR